MLQELMVSIISNLVWAGLIFGYFYVKNSKHRQFTEKCLVSYLLFLSSQRINLQNFIGPYLFLLEKKLDNSEILTRVLKNVHGTCSDVLLQTQAILTMLQDQIPSTELISFYQKSLDFQNRISGSMVQMDLIVGNPQELLESEEKYQKELSVYREFLASYPNDILKIYENLPPHLKSQLPADYQESLTKKLEMGGNF